MNKMIHAQGYSHINIDGRIVRAKSAEGKAHINATKGRVPVPQIQDYQRALAAQQEEMKDLRKAVEEFGLQNKELVEALKRNAPKK